MLPLHRSMAPDAVKSTPKRYKTPFDENAGASESSEAAIVVKGSVLYKQSFPFINSYNLSLCLHHQHLFPKLILSTHNFRPDFAVPVR